MKEGLLAFHINDEPRLRDTMSGSKLARVNEMVFSELCKGFPGTTRLGRMAPNQFQPIAQASRAWCDWTRIGSVQHHFRLVTLLGRQYTLSYVETIVKLNLSMLLVLAPCGKDNRERHSRRTHFDGSPTRPGNIEALSSIRACTAWTLSRIPPSQLLSSPSPAAADARKRREPRLSRRTAASPCITSIVAPAGPNWFARPY